MMIANLLLAISVIIGGAHTSKPAEDDARVEVIWEVSERMSYGMPDAMFVFEPQKRGTFVGVVFPDSITECSVGSFWSKKTQTWSPVRWECP